MSGYLGYDGEQVGRLQLALRRAASDLAPIRSDLPEASAAMMAVRRARDTIDRWLGFVDAVMGCRALLDDSAWDTVHLAGAADALRAIAGDPGRSAMLWESFDRWQECLDRLARDRAEAVELGHERTGEHAATAIARVVAIDRVVDALVATLHAEHRANPSSDAMTLVRHLEPYSAALVLARLGLGADELARAAFAVISAWCDRAPNISDSSMGDAPFDYALDGENAADLLLRTILATPGAAAAFMPLAAQRPETLFAAGDDRALAAEVLLAGTSPGRVSSAVAGTTLTAILRWFREQDGQAWLADRLRRADSGRDWRPVLATAVAPWLIHLSPLDREWPGDAATRRDDVAYVLGDPTALRALLDAADRAAAGLRDDLATRAAAGGGQLSLVELAAFAGMLSHLVVQEHVRDAEAATEAWDLWWRLGDVGLNAIDNPIVSAGAKAAAGRMREYAVAHQLLGAPPAPELVGERATFEREWMLTTMGAGLVDAAVERLVAGGRLPSGTPRPPVPDRTSTTPQLTYEQAYEQWREAVFEEAADSRALEIDAVKSPFLNAADAGRTLAA